MGGRREEGRRREGGGRTWKESGREGHGREEGEGKIYT